jgi:hypothetical protein
MAETNSKAEINSGAAAARDALWVRMLLGELDGEVQCMPLYCDNQSALMREHAAGLEDASMWILHINLFATG